MKESKKLIDEKGIVIVKENGELVKNPAVQAYKDYNAIFNKCCMEIGLSPSARSRLAQLNINAKKESDDPLLKALRGEED
jgi:P27 family predicted phage terminase small subunit